MIDVFNIIILIIGLWSDFFFIWFSNLQLIYCAIIFVSTLHGHA